MQRVICPAPLQSFLCNPSLFKVRSARLYIPKLILESPMNNTFSHTTSTTSVNHVTEPKRDAATEIYRFLDLRSSGLPGPWLNLSVFSNVLKPQTSAYQHASVDFSTVVSRATRIAEHICEITNHLDAVTTSSFMVEQLTVGVRLPDFTKRPASRYLWSEASRNALTLFLRLSYALAKKNGDSNHHEIRALVQNISQRRPR